VWANKALFALDADGVSALHVTGVPPDAYSAAGRCWGNSLYDWQAMESDDYLWWRERAKRNASLYDVIRIDHFIGMVRYFSIDASHRDTRLGRWIDGPGSRLARVVDEAARAGGAYVIAEDLGVVVPAVRQVLADVGWPGMKVLEFAFDGRPHNDHLPYNYEKRDMVVYTGTHDNETLVGYFCQGDETRLNNAMAYLNVQDKADVPWALIRLAYASVANTAIIQMQDVLELGNAARTNFPDKVGSSWRWRLLPGQFDETHIARLRQLVYVYGRLP